LKKKYSAEEEQNEEEGVNLGLKQTPYRSSHMKKDVKKPILIIGEGETEQTYFKEIGSSFKIKVDPDLPSKPDYENIFKRAEAKFDSDIYSHVFCLIDLDYIHRNKKIGEYCETKDKILNKLKKKNLTVIESCPCIEYWFLLHYEYTFSSAYDCSEIENKLKRHIPDYRKNMQGIHKQLRGVEPKALEHSKKAKKHREDNIRKGICTPQSNVTHTDVDILISFIKNHAQKGNNF